MTRRRRRPTRLPYTALFRSAPVAAVAPAAAPEPATAPVQVEERAPWYRRAGPWLAADPRAGTTAPALRPAPGPSPARALPPAPRPRPAQIGRAPCRGGG